MSLKNMDIGSVMRRMAERQIEQAIAQGKFDRIEGMGQDIELEPMPADENARLNWWALRILRQNDVVPDEVRLRKQLDGLRQKLSELKDVTKLAGLVEYINSVVTKINTLGTNALSAPVTPVDLERERRRIVGTASDSQ
jgi:hypothetical protein